MKETYYLCCDKRAYKFALKNYADTFTQVAFCEIQKDTDAAGWLIFENINKKFYVFGHCHNGYLKMELKKFLTIYPEKFEGYYIPYRAQKSRLTGKPLEEYIEGYIINDKDILRTN
ncbi:MAG: hypothetical protein IJ019_03330 [Alphaproteobacteria bacterium]|nr:hypothetical protein [Alphaproteobacteria bacterium]